MISGDMSICFDLNTDISCPWQFSFTDKQIVKLQETPDEIPEGGTPHTVSIIMHGKLVDSGKPGDRVEVKKGKQLYHASLYSIHCTYVHLYFGIQQTTNVYIILMVLSLVCSQITGVYRAMSVRVGPTQRTVKSLFKVLEGSSKLCFSC